MTVKNVFVIESFTQEIRSKMLNDPVMKQEAFMSESLSAFTYTLLMRL